MAKLPKISGKELCKLLEKIGFLKTFGKGSHVKFKHLDGRRTVIPVHGNEDLGPGLLSAILRQIGLTIANQEKKGLELRLIRFQR